MDTLSLLARFVVGSCISITACIAQYETLRVLCTSAPYHFVHHIASPHLFHSHSLHTYRYITPTVPSSCRGPPIMRCSWILPTQDPITTVQQLSRVQGTTSPSQSQSQSTLKEVVGVLLAGQRIFLLNDPASFKVIFKARKELSFDHFAQDVLIKVFGASAEIVTGR